MPLHGNANFLTFTIWPTYLRTCCLATNRSQPISVNYGISVVLRFTSTQFIENF